jgi:DNA polymerase III epsilon subunit-like protein
MLKYNQKYIVFDTETEGLNLHSSKPWQVAWIVCQGERVIETHNRFVDFPDLDVPDIVKKLTGFSWSTYNEKKEPLEDVWSDFKSYLYDPQYKIVGQNLLGFDVYMVSEMQRILGEKPDYSYMERIYDTRPLGKAYRENIDKPKGDMLSWQYKMMHDRSLKAKVSQLQLLKFFDIDFDEAKLHDALYDIQMCYKVFSSIKKGMNL